MDISLSTRTVGERTVLDVAGEVDVYSAPDLRDRIDELQDAGVATMVINLTEVSFIDSTGIGTLVAGLNRAGDLGGTVTLVSDSERILKLFRITGLDTVFAIFASVDEAVAA